MSTRELINLFADDSRSESLSHVRSAAKKFCTGLPASVVHCIAVHAALSLALISGDRKQLIS